MPLGPSGCHGIKEHDWINRYPATCHLHMLRRRHQSSNLTPGPWNGLVTRAPYIYWRVPHTITLVYIRITLLLNRQLPTANAVLWEAAKYAQRWNVAVGPRCRQVEEYNSLSATARRWVGRVRDKKPILAVTCRTRLNPGKTKP